MRKMKKFSIVTSFLLAILLLIGGVLVPLNVRSEKVDFSASAGSGAKTELFPFVRLLNETEEGKKIVQFGLAVDSDGGGDVLEDDGSLDLGEVAITHAMQLDPETRIFSSATITVRTRDVSAIASKGDYDEINQRVTLHAKAYTSLSVNVYDSEFQVGNYARSFYFEIVDIEVSGLSSNYALVEPNESPNSNKVLLSTDATIKVQSQSVTSEDTTFEMLSDIYAYTDSHRNAIYLAEDSFVYNTFNVTSDGGDWYSKVKYMQSKGMVDVAFELDASVTQDSWEGLWVDNSFVIVEISSGGSKNGTYKTNESVGQLLGRWYIKFQSDETEHIGIKNYYEGTFEGVSASNTIGTHASYPGYYQRTNYLFLDAFDLVFSEGTTITTKIYTKEFDADKAINEYMKNKLVPINKHASVEDATIGKLRIDEQGRPKIGMSVRFSEPLQIMKKVGEDPKLPTITAMINGASQNLLDFVYVAGSGTDTFYFEADASDVTTNIYSLEVKSTSSFNMVYDFSPNVSSQGAICIEKGINELYGIEKIAGVEKTCAFDFRKPRVYAYKNAPTTPGTTHNAIITTENVSTSGVIYYGWTDQNPEENPMPPQVLNTTYVSGQGYQTIPAPIGVSGVRWLYVEVVSELGKRSEPELWLGPYYFDNDAPQIEQINLTERTYKKYTFELTIENNKAGLSKKADLKSVIAIVSSDPNGEDVLYEFPYRWKGENLSSDDLTVSIPIEAADVEIDGVEKSFGEFYISFIVKDALENSYQTQPEAYYYDVRDAFNVLFSTKNPIDMTLAEDLGGNSYATVLFKPTGVGEYDKVTFTSKNENIKIKIKQFIRVSDRKEMTEGVDYEEVIRNHEEDVHLLNSFLPGLYKIVFYDTSEGSAQESFMQYLYATMGTDIGKAEGMNKGESTAMYALTQNGSVLTNEVYQLSPNIPYYYATKTGAPTSEYYGNTTLPATFSSVYEALDYVYYHEMLDFYAIKLTNQMASDLNQNISNFRKASNETTEAKEGQVWIRYKNPVWLPTSGTPSWAYYYYSDGTGASMDNPEINHLALSPLLLDALLTVSYNIISYGNYYDLVRSDDLDKYGVPKLDPKQMHVEVQGSSHSKCGTPFTSNVEYWGNPELYVSQSMEAPLSSNVVINAGEYTHLYYKTASMTNYVKITKANGLTLAEYFKVSGRYQILEFDQYGVREYALYVDVDAPQLMVSWVTKSGKTENKVFSESNNNQIIAGTNFTLLGIDSMEYDSLAFVAVYQYHTQGVGTLLETYKAEDFIGGGYPLEDGQYYIHVSDRSGNDYLFTFQIKSTPLVCKIREVENEHIEISVNREASELRYQVYLDGFLLTTDYNQRRFTESGYYQFYIEDIYGNVYDEYCYAYEYQTDDAGNYLVDENGNKIPKLDENGNKIPVVDEEGYQEVAYYLFNRDLPTADWKYMNESGAYVPYTDGTMQMRVVKTSERVYSISTSTTMQFYLKDGCEYEILSGTPEIVKVGLSKWMEIKKLSAFSIKIYYAKHPNSFVIYNCIVDASAPTISVYYQEKSLLLAEYEEINNLSQQGTLFPLENDLFIPSYIGFSTQTERTIYVENGSVAYGDFYRVNVSDSSGVSRLEIYLDGQHLQTKTSDFNNVVISRFGTYQLKAYDNFGNESVFLFTNNRYNHINYTVDGESVSLSENCEQWFDHSKKLFEKTEYGNSQAKVTYFFSASSYYLITDEQGNRYYFAFAIEDGGVYPLQCLVTEGDDASEQFNVASVRGELLIQLLGADIVVDKEYEIAKIDQIGVSIYASIDEKSQISLIVKSNDERTKTFVVENRVLCGDEQTPYYVKTEISNRVSTAKFVDEKGEEYEQDSLSVKLNDSFKVVLVDDDTTLIRVAFSRTGRYEIYDVVYDGAYYDYLFSEEGSYHVEVVNKYGLKTDYYVVLSSSFFVTTAVHYADESTGYYSSEYTMSANNEIFYSNDSVEFFVYSINIRVSVDGVEQPVSVNEQGYTEVYIDKVGTYVVRIWDEFGNEFEKTVSIQDPQAITESEEFLFGFNDEALKRAENYTNKLISIDAEKISAKEIASIVIYYQEQTVIVFDEVGEQKVALSDYALTNCIGLLGDGTYRIVFRDVYGNKAEEQVHYRGTPTLSIERITLNSLAPEKYSMNEDMLANGVWTNNSVSFVISAEEYQLKVDGFENVTVISFENKTKDVYSVTYLDEYGFKYEFNVHLLRQEVEVESTAEVFTAEVGDELVTKEDISVDFTQGAICTYVYDGVEMPYERGEKLYKDGVYRFKVVDLAGNTATYTIRKDSVVEFRLEASSSSASLINGEVTQGNFVQFFPLNSDSAYIKKVFHNNKKIDYSEMKFTERGKWELIIADEVGNEAYFRFYILHGKMDGFVYTVPYDYVITSVVWESGGSTALATETIKELGKRLEATEDGNYQVYMQNSITGEIKTFSFTIDKTPPNVSLVGCEENEKTINDVTVTGYTVGDTIYIYKDGKLIKTEVVTSSTYKAPVISEGGKYRIVVENEAGVTSELVFERKFIPNAAGSTLIIVLAVAMAGALLIGLIWRNHSKTDE